MVVRPTTHPVTISPTPIILFDCRRCSTHPFTFDLPLYTQPFTLDPPHYSQLCTLPSWYPHPQTKKSVFGMQRKSAVVMKRLQHSKDEAWSEYVPCPCAGNCGSDCPCTKSKNFCEKVGATLGVNLGANSGAMFLLCWAETPGLLPCACSEVENTFS